MNRLQKSAWYQLIVISSVLVITGAFSLILVSTGKFKPSYIIWPLLLLIAVHFYRVFFPIKPGEIVYDERDEIINKRATTTAYTVFWIAFIFSCLIPLLALGPQEAMPVSVLPFMLFCGAIIVRLVWSVTILIQYSRGTTDEQ